MGEQGWTVSADDPHVKGHGTIEPYKWKAIAALAATALAQIAAELRRIADDRVLRIENGRLREALREYGEHQSWRCEHREHNFYLVGRDVKTDPDCPCGLDAELRNLGELITDRSGVEMASGDEA